MVIQYSRRRMLALAALPVVAPSFDLPAPTPEPVRYRPVIVGESIFSLYLHREAPTPEEGSIVLEAEDGSGFIVMRRRGLTPEAQRVHDAREEFLARWRRGERLPDPLPDWIVTGRID